MSVSAIVVILLLLIVSAVSLCAAGWNHGLRIGLRKQARICNCSGCARFMRNLEESGEQSVLGYNDESFKEEQRAYRRAHGLEYKEWSP